jgi:phosphatidylinositol alpha-1,6-mannosyltransferase
VVIAFHALEICTGIRQSTSVKKAIKLAVKKILISSTEFPPGPGGIGTHAYQLALNLHNSGWKVLVVSSQDYESKDTIDNFNKEQPFEVLSYTKKNNTLTKLIHRFRTIMKACSYFEPSIVMASGVRAVWLAWIACSLRDIPIVAIAHGGIEFGTSKKWIRFITKSIFNRADGIVCVSEYTRRSMLAMGIAPRQVKVIYNGADNKKFYKLPEDRVAAFREELGLENNLIILTTGSVSERKGQDIVIRSLPKILSKHDNVHYFMAGLPKLSNEFAELAQKLGVDDHVHFLGVLPQERLNLFQNICDIFVMTSRHSRDGDSEGFGIAVVEAALCQKAAVVTGNSGLEEAVLHSVTGLVVPQDDPNSTAEAIIHLLENSSLRNKLANQAYERALKSLSWSKVSSFYESFLKKVQQN